MSEISNFYPVIANGSIRIIAFLIDNGYCAALPGSWDLEKQDAEERLPILQ